MKTATIKNKRFYKLLHAIREGNRPRWTIEKIAEEIYVNRAHLTDVFNNKPGHGAQVRPKLVKFFKKHFPASWGDILAALGWDESGSLRTATIENVPRGTSDVEQITEAGHG